MSGRRLCAALLLALLAATGAHAGGKWSPVREIDPFTDEVVAAARYINDEDGTVIAVECSGGFVINWGEDLGAEGLAMLQYRFDKDDPVSTPVMVAEGRYVVVALDDPLIFVASMKRGVRLIMQVRSPDNLFAPASIVAVSLIGFTRAYNAACSGKG